MPAQKKVAAAYTAAVPANSAKNCCKKYKTSARRKSGFNPAEMGPARAHFEARFGPKTKIRFKRSPLGRGCEALKNLKVE